MREKQIRESIDMIMKGFFDLLKEKDYRKITMSEIATKAMISRMTLYRHFDSKEAIFRWYMESLRKEIMAQFENSDQKDLSQLLYLRNKAIYHNEQLRIILDHEGIETLISEIMMNNRSFFSQFLPNRDTLGTYGAQFVIGGIDQMTTKWLAHKMIEPPELITMEMVRLIDRVMSDEVV
ncbi:MAG: TetR/AcrR family transcriptional regulator [Acholeplasmataceae bacterium]|nr:TetR/AcrR family transcriptional regulator [Acholeplasmataceae bacterium]